MATISFRVPAIPIAQPRQRHRIISGPKGSFVGNYTPKNSPVNAFKAAVQLAATNAYGGAPHDGPVCLKVAFVFPRPKAMCWKTKPTPRAPHCGKPDADNVYKSLVDALSGLIFVDDSRIHSAVIVKAIAAGDEQPHCYVEIDLQPTAPACTG